MRGIEFAATARIAKVLTDGSARGHSAEAGLFDDGLEEHRAIAVAGVPVVGEAAEGEAEEPGGQVPGANPRENRARRVIPGSAASIRIRASSSSLKSRPQHIIVEVSRVARLHELSGAFAR